MQYNQFECYNKVKEHRISTQKWPKGLPKVSVSSVRNDLVLNDRVIIIGDQNGLIKTTIKY